MSYTKQVLASFKAGNTHTVAELNVMLNFKINHPISIICELRKQGHNIQDKWINPITGSRYKKYWLKYVA